MYKLEFKLRQHTPLIHFQHDQVGATLRATEVKPKLDQYIIKKIFKNDFDLCKTFLIGYSKEKENELNDIFNKGNVSLNYKLIIHSKSGTNHKIGYPKRRRTGVIWDDQFPCYFGNMGLNEPNKMKKFVFDRNEIECSLRTIDSTLANYLNEAEIILCSFFLINNFGNRQDKGFGSFTISEFKGNLTNYEISKQLFFISGNQPQIPRNFELTLNQNGYETELNKQWLSKYYSLFNSIDLFYRTLRSGINIPNRLYFKSMMFFYAKNLETPQQWDKKTIRKHFYSEHPNYQTILANRDDPNGTVRYKPDRNEGYDKQLFRDILGLASEQIWKYYGNDTITKTVKNKVGDELKRFKSPITFKPVMQGEKFKVYILHSKIPEIFLGAEAEIKSRLFSNNRNPLSLVIPDSFSIKEYLHWAIKFYQDNNSEISNMTPGTSEEMGIIDNIYEQLYEQISN